MKIISFKEFRKKYGAWWGRFSSTIAATICGISLTFGLTYWKTLNDKKNLLRTSEVWTMYNIEDELEVLNGNVKTLQEKEKTIKTVMKYHEENKLSQCPDTTLSAFTEIFAETFIPMPKDNMAELSFRNMDLLKTAKDFQVIRDLHIIYTVIDLSNNQCDNISKRFSTIGDRYIPNIQMSGGTELDIAKAILSDKTTTYFFAFELEYLVERFYMMYDIANKKYKQEVKRLNITDEEFEMFDSPLFEEYE